MYNTERELTEAIQKEYEKKGIKKPERDELTPVIIREYLKALILNCMQMYMDTRNADYACTLKILLRLFYVSGFDGKARRSQSMEAELIMDIVMPELYEEKPPAEIAEMAVRLLPEIREERRRELRQQRAEDERRRGRERYWRKKKAKESE
jgi:hypothetical protein